MSAGKGFVFSEIVQSKDLRRFHSYSVTDLFVGITFIPVRSDSCNHVAMAPVETDSHDTLLTEGDCTIGRVGWWSHSRAAGRGGCGDGAGWV